MEIRKNLAHIWINKSEYKHKVWENIVKVHVNERLNKKRLKLAP